MFCRPDLIEDAKAAARNRQCLLRIYLGGERLIRNPPTFDLRNYGLYLNQIIATGLGRQANIYAQGMADALAAIQNVRLGQSEPNAIKEGADIHAETYTEDKRYL